MVSVKHLRSDLESTFLLSQTFYGFVVAAAVDVVVAAVGVDAVVAAVAVF